MPTYLYRCDKCCADIEVIRRMNEPDPTTCPHCQCLSFKRVYTPPNLPSAGKELKEPEKVSQKLKPSGTLYGKPYYATRNSGLNAISYVDGVGYVEHSNFAGRPPGSFGKEGRVVVVKDKKNKRQYI